VEAVNTDGNVQNFSFISIDILKVYIDISSESSTSSYGALEIITAMLFQLRIRQLSVVIGT
jgi:hypothetical protein